MRTLYIHESINVNSLSNNISLSVTHLCIPIYMTNDSFKGDAMMQFEAQNKDEWQRDQPVGRFSLRENKHRFQKMEDEFYRNPKSTPALEAAVAAIQKREREKTMSQEIAEIKKHTLSLGAIESVFIKGDISAMNEVQRVEYVREVCRSLGLNPMTQPFDYISFQGRIQLYAKKGATDQLRSLYDITLSIVTQTMEDGLLTVTARAQFPNGRSDEDVGVVNVGGLKGEALANAKMKAVTKAKRRVTLSICGLGMLDESETDSIPNTIKGERVFEQEKRIEQQPQHPSLSQLKRLFTIAGSQGISNEELKEIIIRDYGHASSKDLNIAEYNKLCGDLAVRTPPPAMIEPGEDKDEDPQPVGMSDEVPWAKYRENHTK